ncbi:MAG: SRPBCC family protein [Rhodobacteraceae bacterium]|nr:SRPBCC family protein [Paracoccaceae bacterium]
MQFSAREDIEAPIEEVFRAVANFEGWERAALRRGAEITRTDTMETPSKGMTWAVQFSFRNRIRKADLELTELDAPNKVRVFATASGVESSFYIELVSLSRVRTRMDVSTGLKPTTISARLLLQPMKLGRAKLSNRFRKRIADFAGAIEDGYHPPNIR